MTAPAIGDRMLFTSSHVGHETLTGKPCTVIEVYDSSIQWPFAVRFDNGITCVAVDRNLAPIAADGSIGEPLQPAPHSRKGWDGFLKMLEHSGARLFVHPDGNVWPSIIPPTREEIIASIMTVPITVSWDDGRTRTYTPGPEEAEAIADDGYVLDDRNEQLIDESNAALTETTV